MLTAGRTADNCRVMHPSSGLTKEYSVTLDRKPTLIQLEKMAGGCQVRLRLLALLLKVLDSGVCLVMDGVWLPGRARRAALGCYLPYAEAAAWSHGPFAARSRCGMFSQVSRTMHKATAASSKYCRQG